MKKGIYYVKELNCICVVYENVKDMFEKNIRFSAATFLDDAFTTISHYECNKDIFKRCFKPIRLTKKNYKNYLSLDNGVNSTRVINTRKSYSYKFSTDFGLKCIDRRPKVSEVRPFYSFLESENFNKEEKRYLVVTTIYEI